MTTATIPAVQMKREWAITGGLWLVATGVILALFADTSVGMVKTWLHSATYNHCILIPVVSAYLIWERREIFTRTAPSPCIPALLLVAAAGFLWLLGRLVGVQMVEEFALVFTLQAMTLTVVGVTVTRALLLPIGFLLFAVPFGDFLVQPLQNVTADFIVWALRLIDIPVFRDGVFLSTPTGEFHVAEACSGVRFLIAMVPLGVLIADMAFKSWRRKAAVIALSFIIPIVANGIRAFGIVYIAYLTNNEYATGVDHIVYGWIFFSIVMLALIFISMSFSDKPIDQPDIDFSWVAPNRLATPVRLGAAVALTVAVTALWPWLAHGALTASPVPLASIKAPEAVGDWHAVEKPFDWRPQYNGVSDDLMAAYARNTGEEVIFYYGYYESQNDNGELIQFGNGVTSDKWDWSASRNRDVAWNGGGVTARESEITTVAQSRRVWHWYWIGGRLTSNDYMAKALHLLARLSGGDDNAAVIVMSTPEGYRPDEAPEVLADFLMHIRSDLPGLQTTNKE